ncbi:MAG TPA: hypothetical protein VFD39_04690 [Trueperaceae bacterium]|nr:hypothetical protein [Trueperaceae bacterium]
MITMMMVVGGFALMFGITRMVVFAVGLGPGQLEELGPRRSEGVIFTMILMVFGLLVFGLGLIWNLAGTVS